MGIRLLKIVAALTVGWLLITVIAVLVLRWVEPPTTAFMVQRRLTAWRNNSEPFRLDYQWVDWLRISPHAPLAVVAAEDQKFPTHWGFDWESIAEAWGEKKAGIRTRGASTISQQVAKNLFLWPGKNLVRKGLEAYFTLLIEMCWPKRRILEMYLNVAQLGDSIFGIGAASRRFLKTTPRQLGRYDCALMAAVLPNPRRLHLNRPSAYVRERAAWILSEMNRLDRIDAVPYLQEVWPTRAVGRTGRASSGSLNAGRGTN